MVDDVEIVRLGFFVVVFFDVFLILLAFIQVCDWMEKMKK